MLIEELEAYSILVSALRAQGDLTNEKLVLLKQLQKIFRFVHFGYLAIRVVFWNLCLLSNRISLDRHKAELRRATNDEKLFTIAKRLSCTNCVSKEWIKESKRQIPLLGNYQFHAGQSINASKSQKIIAEQVVQCRANGGERNSQTNKMDCEFSLSVNSNPHDLSDCDDDDSIVLERVSHKNNQPSEQNQNLVNLKNGYRHDSTILNGTQSIFLIKKPNFIEF